MLLCTSAPGGGGSFRGGCAAFGGPKTCFCCFGHNQMCFSVCFLFRNRVCSEYLTVDEGTFSPFSYISKDLIKIKQTEADS